MEPSFIYAWVARRAALRRGVSGGVMGDTMILADFSSHSGSFRQAAEACMSRLDPSSIDVSTWTVDGLTVTCLCQAGMIHGVISRKDTIRTLNRSFLKRLGELFWKAHKAHQVWNAEAGGLQAAFGPQIGNLLQHINQHPEDYNIALDNDEDSEGGNGIAAHACDGARSGYATPQTNAVAPGDKVVLKITDNPLFEDQFVVATSDSLCCGRFPMRHVSLALGAAFIASSTLLLICLLATM